MPKQLPDTPWHIGYSKMRESDQRRLNKRCVHYDASICRAPKSGCYLLRCGGSSHCRFYAEDENTSKRMMRNNRTQTEIEAENRRKYVETLKPKMRALVSSSDDRRYKSARDLKSCYVCGRPLLESGKYRKQCILCHMEYVDQVSWLTDGSPTDGRFVYVMGRKKPAEVAESLSMDQCRFCNGNGICWDSDSPLYRNQCDPKRCKKLKTQKISAAQAEAPKFTGVKNIPINSIAVANVPAPGQRKIDCAAKVIRRNGRVTVPLYVGVSEGRYLLKEGHVRYLAARQCGLSTVPATMEWKYVTRAKKK